MKYSRLISIYTGISLVFLLTILQGTYSQTIVNLSFNQPDQLVADAGDNATINAGESVVIGGSPTATGGVSSYSYIWNWAPYLNDHTAANPVATPTGTMTFTVSVTDDNGCTDTDGVTITVLGGSGISDVKTGIKLKIFPNPTSSSFTICIDNITGDKELKIAIIKLSGQKVYEEIFKDMLSLEKEINISQWPKGYYMITIDGESTRIAKQLILH